MKTKLLAISVDLDGLRFYEQIHGLHGAVTGPCPVYSTALERLHAWATSLSVPLTWFVVGADARAHDVRERLCRLHASGDELGCHSEHHYYDLTRRDTRVMRDEVQTSMQRLTAMTGEKRIGFRAPGYRITNELVAHLVESNALYDSSLFPCPSYYAAKACVLLGQKWLGRSSHAILDTPRVTTARRMPYRMGRDYLREGDGLLELPISVTPRLRLPFIGTFLSMFGRDASRVIALQMRNQPFVNLELHGIDALDERDGVGKLAGHQPDLRVPWQRKLESFESAILALQKSGFATVTLRDAAIRLGAKVG